MSEPEEPVTAPNWAEIAEQAARNGFGVPDSSASGPEEQLPPRVPLEPPKRGRGRPRKNAGVGAPSTPPKAESKPSLPPYREGMFVQPLEEMYAYVGMGLMLVDPVCATALLNSAHDCAVSIDKLAKTNHTVRRMLVSLTTTSAIGVVVVAHLPILAAVVLHHVPLARDTFGPLGEQLLAGMMAAAQQRNGQPTEDQSEPAAA